MLKKSMRVNCDEDGITKASKIIEQGGVIVFPTDTLYGIGCDPYNSTAVKKIYEIKSREERKQLPVLVYSKDVALIIANFDQTSKVLAEKFWPGPLTLILKVSDESLKKALNLDEKIAIRVPNNDCTLKLLKKCNFLVGTSANISGQEPFTEPSECYESIQGFDLFLDGGKIAGGVASTIVEVMDGRIKIHREGVLTAKEINKVL